MTDTPMTQYSFLTSYPSWNATNQNASMAIEVARRIIPLSLSLSLSKEEYDLETIIC